jgi:hypothetical protein
VGLTFSISSSSVENASPAFVIAMDIPLTNHLIDRLKANVRVFQSLLANVGDEQARWKPASDKWSLLEVTCHLADEERDDFRHRLDLTLHHPGEPWPPIDPPRWAIERMYNERDLAGSLDDFVRERLRSVAWLTGLDSVNPEASAEHPQLGRMTAGMLFTSWLAHDLIHIRQMTRLHYEYLTRVMSSHSPAYAGDW